MMNFTTQLSAVRVDHPAWPGFYLLIVSNADDTKRNIYLTHDKIGVIHYLYGAIQQSDGSMETIEETVNIAFYNMEDYLPEFVEACCDRD